MTDTKLLTLNEVEEIEAAKAVARFKQNTWHRINGRTINGSCPDYKNPSNRRYLTKGVRLEMTRAEFYQWCDGHRADIVGLYRQGLKPTIDRKEDSGHYSRDNIRIADWSSNSRHGGKIGGDRTALRTSRAIIGTALTDPSKLLRFRSSHDAARNGFHQGNVTSCLTGKRKSAGGYRWSYQTKK